MKKILIANRGEIAIRIMRSAHEMNIKTVAVFSEADRLALHVQYANEAVYIGEAASSSSYLNIDRIIEACKITGADAIHPGYGFLSENADFARAVKAAGITLIGPSPESMEVMGNKLAAKTMVKKYQIPMVPGTDEPVNDINEAIKQAENIGFPVLIKAAAGGGGKGMRIVNEAKELKEQLQLAISEAKAFFGDSAVFLERYIHSPKHIEIQILADQYGHTIHLFERECSIQRRHQKVIEEAPSPILSEDLRQKMGEYAIKVAQACNYVGAGTVEFIVDEHLNFYFLEMNTRLQVEHPITEMITGIDLVKEQINIAKGKELTIKQGDLNINGHAIELRIYAEDPENNFLPDTGTLQTYILPEGPGIRVDNSYREGMEIPVYYDPMISKLIAWGKNREEAIARMSRAIEEYQITGIQSTLSFGRFVMKNEAFKKGEFDTHFVDKHFTNHKMDNNTDEDRLIIAAITSNLWLNTEGTNPGLRNTKPTRSNWKKNQSKY